MIFITIGTTGFSFDRVDVIVGEVVKKFPKEEIIYQSKTSKVNTASNLKIYNEMKYPNFIKYIKNARVIITHGGPATIYLALTYGKSMPFVLPRKEKLLEHVSDHQIHFARFMAKKKLAKIPVERSKIANQVIKYCRHPEPNEYESDSRTLKVLIEKLGANIDKLS